MFSAFGDFLSIAYIQEPRWIVGWVTKGIHRVWVECGGKLPEIERLNLLEFQSFWTSSAISFSVACVATKGQVVATMVVLFCRNTLKLRIELPRAYQNRRLKASVPVLTWTRASHLSGASGGRRETFLGDILHSVTLCDTDINGDAWVPSGATRWSSLLWSHVLKMK